MSELTAVILLPCPFCNSTNVDPEGWASQAPDGSNRKTGPACDDCGASAETTERWNTRFTQPVSETWRGIGKVVEEYGEVLQLLGKLIECPTGGHHDGEGKIRDRLPAEIADARAATDWFESWNGLFIDSARRASKFAKFREWRLAGLFVRAK